MIPNRLRGQSNKVWQFGFLLFACVAALTRQTGKIGDYSIYFSGGEKILHGVNAYGGENQYFSGPLGGVAFYIIGQLACIHHTTLVIQGINIIGLAYFFYTMLNRFGNRDASLIITGLLVVASTAREMVINNQVTGIALGLVGIALHLNEVSTVKYRTVAAISLLYVALEMKPNLVLGFAIYLTILARKKWKEIVFALPIILLVFSIIFGFSSYIDWVKALSKSGAKRSIGFESLSPLSYFVKLNLLSELAITLLGFAVFLSLSLFVVERTLKSKNLEALIIASNCAICFPYLHFLDFNVVLPFVVLCTFSTKSFSSLTPLAIMFLYFPGVSSSGTRNFLFLTISIGTLLLFSNIRRQEFPTWRNLAFVALTIGSNFLLKTNDIHSAQLNLVLRAWIFVQVIYISTLIKSSRAIGIPK